MLRRRLCRCDFLLEFECEGPLLIADGAFEVARNVAKKKSERDGYNTYPTKLFISRTPGADAFAAIQPKSNPALAPIPANKLNLDFYVPGTSLRGPIRAHAERIIRSLRPAMDQPPDTACDPFDKDDNPQQGSTHRSCSNLLSKNNVETPYRAVCPACKLFGCAGLASRLTIGDAPLGQQRSVYRDMIGIDRVTGGASSGAKMCLHALEGSRWQARLSVENYELWQLGLLAYVFQELADERIAFGFGKTKGFGQAKARVAQATFRWRQTQESGVQHLGSLMDEPECEKYGVERGDAIKVGASPAATTSTLGEALVELDAAEQLQALWEISAAAFNARMARPVTTRTSE